MAQVSLTREERNVLVAILARHVGLTALERQNTLQEAGLGNFLQRLDLQQSSKMFAGSLVDVLQKRGTLQETGTPALVNLLQWLAENEDVGGDEEESEFITELLGRPYVRVNKLVASQPVSPSPIISSQFPYVKTPTTAQQRLLNVMLNPDIPPPERAEAGRKLANIGDPRPGVGLRNNGLPDIRWCVVPDKGVYRLQTDQHAHLSLLTRERREPTFWIAAYPITNLQFQLFVDAAGYEEPKWWETLEQQTYMPSRMKWTYSNHPRENVNWYEAMAFCAWLSAITTQYERRDVLITLPTEDQWEKAARGNEGWFFPWGNDYKSGYANIDEKSADGGPYYLGQPSAVGIYPQGESPYGVLDMSGNIWEWCLKTLDMKLNNFILKLEQRARGGSWYDTLNNARAASRRSNIAYDRSSVMGFRVVRNSAPHGSELWNSKQR